MKSSQTIDLAKLISTCNLGSSFLVLIILLLDNYSAVSNFYISLSP